MAPAKKHIKTNFSSNWISARGRDMKKPARPKKAITPVEKKRKENEKKAMLYTCSCVCTLQGPKRPENSKGKSGGEGASTHHLELIE
jgi:hypothetical protein